MYSKRRNRTIRYQERWRCFWCDQGFEMDEILAANELWTEENEFLMARLGCLVWLVWARDPEKSSEIWKKSLQAIITCCLVKPSSRAWHTLYGFELPITLHVASRIPKSSIKHRINLLQRKPVLLNCTNEKQRCQYTSTRRDSLNQHFGSPFCS